MFGGMAQDPERIAHFQIKGRLGRGGMGVVYRAIDEKLDREVAVKVLAPYVAGDPEARARMLREARAAAGLTHRNIVTVYEIGDDGDHFYIAMELIEGDSLRALLHERSEPLAWQEAVRIARAVASALAKAHAAGVVHRDLKPDNVLVARDGEIKLVDFGVAKLIARKPVGAAGAEARTEVEALTASGSWVGTPGYMAPESFGDGGVDGRADLFALGALLYELLTKQRAFRGDSPADTMRKVMLDDPPAPRTIVPEIPRALEALVMRCLAKSRATRIGTADELLSELERVADVELATLDATSVSNAPGLSTADPSATPAPHSTTTLKRRLWAVAGVLAALLAVAVAVGVTRQRARSGAPVMRDAIDAGAPSPFVDLGPVATCNEAARRGYREAMRVLHDMGSRVAEEHFRKAAGADPQCAVLQLRAALYAHGDATQREAFQRALGMIGALLPREAALAQAYVPEMAREPPDEAATSRALVTLADARPGDAELSVLASYGAPDLSTARRLAERARDLDPSFADVWDALIDVAMRADDPKAARAAVDACADHAPAATGCKESALDLSWKTNDCAGLEKQARQFNLQADQTFTSGFTDIAFARATRDPESPLVEEAIDQWERRMNKPHLFVAETWRVGRKVLLGDFTGADADLRKLSDGVKAETDLDPHVRVGALALELLVERGDEAAAARFAVDFLSRQQAWNRPVRPIARVSSLEPRMGSLVASSPLHDRWDRAAWQKELSSSGLPPEAEWAYGTAMFVRSEADAREAMRTAPPTRVIPYDAVQVELLIGRTALLAGDTKAAISHLERAAHRCDALYNPFQHVRAWLWLGKAREAARDEPGACAGYEAVLTRWGKANARSVSADEARARVHALGCK
jgi:eukaryotic-like serine/threonine-protein kinase